MSLINKRLPTTLECTSGTVARFPFVNCEACYFGCRAKIKLVVGVERHF